MLSKMTSKLLLCAAMAMALVSADAVAASARGGFSGGRGGFSGGRSSAGSRAGSWSKPSTGGSKAWSSGKSWSSGGKSSGSSSSSKAWSAGSSSKSWSSGGKSSGSWLGGGDKAKKAPESSSWSSRSGSWAGGKKPEFSSADKALAEKARQAGTCYTSRADAEKAFADKCAPQFTSKYADEPKARPGHIPQVTVVNGHTHTVVYERRRGGYGYYRDGEWVVYDAIRDAVMLSTLMSRHNYYYPVAAPASGGVAYAPSTDGTTVLYVFLGILGVVAIVMVVGVIFK